MRKITVTTDFTPPPGTEWAASQYPEPGAYLIDMHGMKQVAFVATAGVITMVPASNIIFDGNGDAPLWTSTEAIPSVSEDFALRMLATALNPGPRSTP